MYDEGRRPGRYKTRVPSPKSIPVSMQRASETYVGNLTFLCLSILLKNSAPLPNPRYKSNSYSTNQDFLRRPGQNYSKQTECASDSFFGDPWRVLENRLFGELSFLAK